MPTGICALNSAGCLADTELTEQVAVPFPLGQPLVNVGFWLGRLRDERDGQVRGRSVVLGRDPHDVSGLLAAPQTLACERWTLTHSSGWADVLVELGLARPRGR